MTINQLEKQQQKEVDDYWRNRAKRLTALENEQKQIVTHCIIVSPQTQSLLKKLLSEQRKAWEEMEKDELDMMRHIHTLERENLLDKEAKRKELITFLSSPADKSKDRGR